MGGDDGDGYADEDGSSEDCDDDCGNDDETMMMIMMMIVMIMIMMIMATRVAMLLWRLRACFKRNETNTRKTRPKRTWGLGGVLFLQYICAER